MFVLPVITYILGNALRQKTCEPNEKFTKKHPPKKLRKLIASLLSFIYNGRKQREFVCPACSSSTHRRRINRKRLF